ncbi:MAG: hypothetical protein IPL78_12250 [Chloroflexi bacterium]|nr:hypothetical protein [Chloroflexota bacterium]
MPALSTVLARCSSSLLRLIGSPAAAGVVLELSSLIAMVVYALLAWALERIVWVIFYRPSGAVTGVTQTTTQESQ